MIPLTYITAIQIYLIVWLWTEFEPLQDRIDIFFESKDGSIWEMIYQIIQCKKCLNFWIILIMTFNPFLAILFSMVAQIHEKIIK